jgi:uncharacterized protein
VTPEHLIPVGVALLAGALNAVAGGGSFFTFPTLIVFAGLGSIAANATSTVALWPASAASALALRRDLGLDRSAIAAASVASLTGGAIGAALLLRTPTRIFDGLVPFLVLLATAVFTFGGALTKRLRARQGAEPGAPSPLVVALVQLVIGVYGGYFGGGIGFMMLATFVLLGQRDMNAMNAQKNLFAFLMNGSAVVTFVASGAIVWRFALPMAVAATLGGYVGAAAARRADPRYVRPGVAAVGWAYFFYRAYGRG